MLCISEHVNFYLTPCSTLALLAISLQRHTTGLLTHEVAEPPGLAREDVHEGSRHAHHHHQQVRHTQVHQIHVHRRLHPLRPLDDVYDHEIAQDTNEEDDAVEDGTGDRECVGQRRKRSGDVSRTLISGHVIVRHVRLVQGSVQ